MIEIERFRAGTYVQSGAYRCFAPSPVNRKWVWSDTGINFWLEKAAHKLGELSAVIRLSPDADMFVLLRVGGEAVLSSRIEGTRTELDEALTPEEEINPDRLADWQEVKNYIAALEEAESSALPVSSRLIKKAHKTLMHGVRG
ncbi:MAG: Fic family protein, partial [Betaproteobacteria bacterium]|nr:Fic family protein [Betaproteobacteria bacterium]